MPRLRVRQKISSQFQVLRRLADKARKSMNIKHIQNFRNAVRRDACLVPMLQRGNPYGTHSHAGAWEREEKSQLLEIARIY